MRWPTAQRHTGVKPRRTPASLWLSNRLYSKLVDILGHVEPWNFRVGLVKEVAEPEELVALAEAAARVAEAAEEGAAAA